MNCHQCMHPSCPHSLATNQLCPCTECQTGIFVLDASLAPKWKVNKGKISYQAHMWGISHVTYIYLDFL
jgi:hypothetical protein